MLVKSLLDRLAEATTEWLHAEIRRRYWGYAEGEALTAEDMFALRYQGIRPAVGYPSLPDQLQNFDLQAHLGSAELGISLTESGVMMPNASVSGLVFAHPSSKYFAVGRIDDEQTRDYAERRGLSPERLAPYLLRNTL